MVLSTGGDLLAIVGLVALIHQRLPERSADSLAEALLSTLALGFVILALVVVPSQGWRPGSQVPAIVAPLLDMVLLWLVCSLVSLTGRHPASYRFLIAGFACLFVANASYSAPGALRRRQVVDARGVSLPSSGRACGGGLRPPVSRKVAFDPVPLRSVRPRGVRVAMLVAVGLVVPGRPERRVRARDPTTASRVLLIGSTLLPSLLVLYLLHQVFTHAAAEYRAQHDSLTGVCNRLLFEDRLQLELAHAERTNSAVSVMFLDLDRFKDINDSLGHAVGNDLLKAGGQAAPGCLARAGHPGPLRR